MKPDIEKIRQASCVVKGGERREAATKTFQQFHLKWPPKYQLPHSAERLLSKLPDIEQLDNNPISCSKI